MATRLISTAALLLLVGGRKKAARFTGANFFLSSLSVLPIVRRRTATKMRGTELIVHTLTTLSLRPLASSVCLSLAFSIQYSVVAPPRAVSHGNFQPNGPVQTFCTTRTRPNSFIIAPANSFVIGPAVINTHSFQHYRTNSWIVVKHQSVCVRHCCVTHLFFAHMRRLALVRRTKGNEF